MSVVLDDDTAQRLLDQLIYQQVRQCVNLADVCMFEHDLEDMLAEVTKDDGAPAAVVASSLIDRAWARVDEDLRVLRETRRSIWSEASEDREVRP